jgi:hypothetical protein
VSSAGSELIELDRAASESGAASEPAAGLMVLAAVWALGSLGPAADPRTLRKLHQLRRQQLRKAVAGLLAGGPKARPGPHEWDEIDRNAGDLGVDRDRFTALARDPAHGWAVNDNAIMEARIAVRMERWGRLHDVVRSPAPEADLVEDGGAGRSWDVKTFPGVSYKRHMALDAIRKELDHRGNAVIVNTVKMSSDQVADLRMAVARRGWASYVLFGSSA